MTTEEVRSYLDRIRQLDRDIRLLSHTAALLTWDQETYMPARGIAERAEQLSFLEGQIHRRITSTEMGEILEALGSTDEQPLGDPSLESRDRALLRQLRRAYGRASKLPERLVTRLARTASRGQAIWQKARRDDDYNAFAPVLGEIIELQIELAEHIGYEEHPYDALLDGFEPWMKTSSVESVFEGLQRDLVPIVQAVADQPRPDTSFLEGTFPVEKQRAFGEEVLRQMGYEFDRGRLDVSAHPFTIANGGDDVRITTRFHESDPLSGLFSSVHEGGHALYELGFPDDLKLTVLGEATSLGIHESQSRLWENIIGHSRSFWTYYYPRMQDLFSDQLGSIDLDLFYRAINRIEPSLIRIEADEVTYNLHILLRFNLERRIIEQDLSVGDLPEAWREESKRLLGVAPETDRDGVLQDVHWSTGGFGYFPTYALGNLYAAQFYSAMRRDIVDLDDIVRRGELRVVLQWLRRNIHSRGSTMAAEELCNHVTGEYLSPQYFVSYLKDKYRGVYDLP
ncbi:MAG: carboxypeptidase M32 [Spirochaetaceae bacterium]